MRKIGFLKIKRNLVIKKKTKLGLKHSALMSKSSRPGKNVLLNEAGKYSE